MRRTVHRLTCRIITEEYVFDLQDAIQDISETDEDGEPHIKPNGGISWELREWIEENVAGKDVDEYGCDSCDIDDWEAKPADKVEDADLSPKSVAL